LWQLAHVRVACASCHKAPAAPGKALAAVGTQCVACHRADDPHNGEFGPQCARCHRTSAWRDIKPFGTSTIGRDLWRYAAAPRGIQ